MQIFGICLLFCLVSIQAIPAPGGYKAEYWSEDYSNTPSPQEKEKVKFKQHWYNFETS